MPNSILQAIANEIKIVVNHNPKHLAALELEVATNAPSLKTDAISLVENFMANQEGLTASEFPTLAEDAANALLNAVQTAIAAKHSA